MKTKQVRCLDCNSPMIKTSAQMSKKDILVGYYCLECKKIYDLNITPLIPASVILSLTPGLDEYSKEEAYKAIFKVLKNPEKIIVKKEDDPISLAGDQIGSSLHKFCREPGDHEPVRLDRDTFKKDLQKEAENIFKKYPKKHP